tara:strand:- start:2771 stop:3400 length:630 start_codon:yes stop_codon:yes gene_type:complete
MRKYAIKEIFYSIQGEGYHVGKPAIFIRFTGCNFWNGKEKDRSKAICNFCDTDFLKTDGQNGGRYTSCDLIDKIKTLSKTCKYVVLTGGEPLLQVNHDLVEKFKENEYYVAIETNGSKIPPKNIDWICCSPKSLNKLNIMETHELKVVYPAIDPLPYSKLIKAQHYYIQPLDHIDPIKRKENVKKCIEYCKENTKWKLSIQAHKYLEVD